MLSIREEIIKEHPYFVHYKTALPCQFDLRTKESFFSALDEVASKAGNIGPTAFGTLQTNLGITWNPDGVTMDSDMRHIFTPPCHTYFDPMHCLPGGTSLYEVNEWVLPCLP